MTPAVILVLNAGSSSLKYALYAIGDGGVLARRGSGEQESGDGTSAGAGLQEVLAGADAHRRGEPLVAVGHRVVHGGAEFPAPVCITPEVLAALERLCPLAPIHQPPVLALVKALAGLRPSLPQVACFDTSFHHGQDPIVTRFGIPRELDAAGIRRYGFHGLSFEYVIRRLAELDPDLARGQVIVAHLGSGASLCALRDGRSVDTTMGFSVLDGLVMSTRCGALDPGVVMYLQRERGMTVGEVEAMLYHRSGLAGVSGISGDLRVLLASDAPEARDAVELVTFRIARETGALAASLGGLDGLVFTGGIGEHAPAIRASVCARLAWLGAALDQDANRRGQARISTEASRVGLWTIPTNEELVIAEHTRDVLWPDAARASSRPAGTR
jgi:acetate kinase